MLIRLVIENFRSIRDAVELSMRASSEVPRREAGEPVLCKAADELEVLRCANLYGANAVGKSNLVEALLVARRLVVDGTAQLDARRPGLVPFRLDAEHRARPSRIELHVLVDGRVYRYGFSATDQAIEEESLATLVDGQEHPLLSRSHDRIDLSGALTREVEDPQLLEHVARGTPRGRLFLHEATHSNVDSRTLAAIFSWFEQQLTIIPPTPDPQQLITRIDTDASFRGFLERVMRWADIGIRELFSCMATTPDEGEQLSLRFRHGDDGTAPTFELDDESAGTRRLLHLASVLYQAFQGHKVLVIDDIDRSLHSVLVRDIVETFIERLPSTTQLVFTTCDTNLMVCRGLRSDCIWFTEKTPAGATRLSSLAELDACRERQHEERE